MTDTNQLPEPELGYIQTDKSNQPAFSARQMREDMKPTTTVPVGEIKWAANVPNSIKEAVFYDLMPPIGTKLYTSPQPAQATQAEVTDEQIDALIGSPWMADHAKQSYREFARAILALHPERVPMTLEQIADACNETKASRILAFLNGVRNAEAHHSITAQAKKETP